MTLQDIGNGVYRVVSPQRSAITGRYVMNQRDYESALKDLLEEVALVVEDYDPDYLRDLYMPQNVPGIEPITLDAWLDARWTKRNNPKMP